MGPVRRTCRGRPRRRTTSAPVAPSGRSAPVVASPRTRRSARRARPGSSQPVTRPVARSKRTLADRQDQISTSTSANRSITSGAPWTRRTSSRDAPKENVAPCARGPAPVVRTSAGSRAAIRERRIRGERGQDSLMSIGTSRADLSANPDRCGRRDPRHGDAPVGMRWRNSTLRSGPNLFVAGIRRYAVSPGTTRPAPRRVRMSSTRLRA